MAIETIPVTEENLSEVNYVWFCTRSSRSLVTKDRAERLKAIGERVVRCSKTEAIKYLTEAPSRRDDDDEDDDIYSGS